MKRECTSKEDLIKEITKQIASICQQLVRPSFFSASKVILKQKEAVLNACYHYLNTQADEKKADAILEMLIGKNKDYAYGKSSQTKRLVEKVTAYRRARVIYHQGQDAEKIKDYKNAMRYYQEAGELKLPEALTSAATLMLKGYVGIPQDKQQAFYFLLTTAAAGYQRAMLNLAIQLDKGGGVPQNQKQALFWYRKNWNEVCLKRAEALEKKFSL